MGRNRIERQHKFGRSRALVLLLLLTEPLAWGNPQQASPSQEPDLTQVSIENLMKLQVSSASKKEQSVSHTAAAIYVITQEDIRRSGMTTVPELLRMVPGLDVAQIDASNWAISSRGFNERLADTLLVLIDGRSLYSPNFAGVFWQVQQLTLEDIDRIEVIRGPGATLWGANAVSGVINIITKKAKDTQDSVVSLGGGMQQRAFVAARYGAAHGDNLSFRIYGDYFNRDEFQTSAGQEAADNWQGGFGGFRSDWQLTQRDSFTLEGDAYRDSLGDQIQIATFSPPYGGAPLTTTTYTGGDINGRWTRTYSPKSEFSLQMYYDGLSRDEILVSSFTHTLNVNFQHHFAWGGRQDIIWGAEYRFTDCPTTSTSFLSFNPTDLHTHLPRVFAQDEIALWPGRLWFTPGIEFEHSPFTGPNIEPSSTLLWAATENQSLWLSAAQSTRTPQRSDRGLHDIVTVIPGPGGSLTSVDIIGSPAASDETYLDFQAGYRAQLTRTVSTDIVAFYDHYRDLQTEEPGAPFFSNTPVPHTVLPLYYANRMHGKGYGGEFLLRWKPVSRWKLEGSYSNLKQILQLNPGSQDTSSVGEAGDSPRHQFQIRSQLNLPKRGELDASVYRVGHLVNQAIPGYTRLDVRLGWHARESWDFDLVGQNLLTPRHLEFLNNTGLVPTYVPRQMFARLTWRTPR
ncbi:MAG TPA: TonB-dependent receptor [Methylomirabilota bacterium]|nr:TonB-dependent receptor [Methylomirabilota bacterium]